jgi:ribosomal protein L2
MVLTNNNIGVGSIVVANVHSAAATANQFVKKKSAGAAVQCLGRIRPAARLRLARGESRKEWLTRAPEGRRSDAGRWPTRIRLTSRRLPALDGDDCCAI